MPVRLYLSTLLALWSSFAISQQKGNPAIPCFRALAGEQQFAPIKDKVSLGGSMDEMRRMTISGDRASQPEATALAAWKRAREACHQRELPYYATRDLGIQVLALEHFAAVQGLIDDLRAGSSSYGEFGKRRIELYEKVNRDIDRVRQSILPAKPVPHGAGKK